MSCLLDKNRRYLGVDKYNMIGYFIYLITLSAIVPVGSQLLDNPRGPWQLVFKVIQGEQPGSYNDIYDFYSSNDALNSDDISARTSFNLTSSPFKSTLLQKWEDKIVNVQAVKLSFFKNGTEQAYVVWDAVGKGKDDWFDCSRILYSSYTDITTKAKNTCDMQAGSTVFTVLSSGVMQSACEENNGWFFAMEQSTSYHPCPYAPIAVPRPYFLYASGTKKSNLSSGMENADAMAIFIQAWDMVFKATTGGTSVLFSTWISENTINDDGIETKTYLHSAELSYKSSVVNNWQDYFIDNVKYSMFQAGLEQAYVVFNGINSSNTDWFADDRILYSKYSDMAPGGTYCSMQGNGLRSWQIQKTEDPGCEESAIWMNIIDGTNTTLAKCSWDSLANPPYFLHSNEENAVACDSGNSWAGGDCPRSEIMGVFVHGWHLVLKVSAGIDVSPADSLYSIWTTPGDLGTATDQAKSFLPGTPIFKSGIVDDWTNEDIRAVRISMFSDNVEVAYFVFDAVGADSSSWFTIERLLYSSYTDVTTSSPALFGLEGDGSTWRFSVLESTGCGTNNGWFSVLDVGNTDCGLQDLGSFPQFVYTEPPQHGAMQGALIADSFAVFVDREECIPNPCQNSTICESLAGDFRCHCTGDYFGKTCADRDGGWSDWDDWSACPVTCGGSNMTKTRQCDNPEPKGNGVCLGQAIDYMGCAPDPCPIHGEWSEWYEWDNCTSECGGGTHTRQRECNNPQPQHGGMFCIGNDTETAECNIQHCPIDGLWSNWTDWSVCSKTCDGGVKFRTRQCNEPPPQYGGENCPGVGIDSQECNTDITCPPVDGDWSDWSDWSDCSVTCGGGVQRHTRACDDPLPEYGGSDCVGVAIETVDCNNDTCPIYGNWSEWAVSEICANLTEEVCGTGQQNITRHCSYPVPRDEVLDCPGVGQDTQPCNVTCSATRIAGAILLIASTMIWTFILRPAM